MSEVQTPKVKAFNIIMEGVGYLNRIREVKPKKGPAYLACTINGLMGLGDDVQYQPIDCTIVGQQAIEAVKLLEESVNAKHKVLVGFRASDPKPDVYDYEHKGETKHVEGLKARLLQLTLAKVNGQLFTIPLVERPTPAAPPAQQGQDPVPASAAAPQPGSRRANSGAQPEMATAGGFDGMDDDIPY